MNVNIVAEGFRFDFDELWEIVSSVQAVRGDTVYKIEVLLNLKNASPQYSVRYFIRSNDAWKTFNFGAVFADTPELALSQGLGFVKKQTSS